MCGVCCVNKNRYTLTVCVCRESPDHQHYIDRTSWKQCSYQNPMICIYAGLFSGQWDIKTSANKVMVCSERACIKTWRLARVRRDKRTNKSLHFCYVWGDSGERKGMITIWCEGVDTKTRQHSGHVDRVGCEKKTDQISTIECSWGNDIEDCWRYVGKRPWDGVGILGDKTKCTCICVSKMIGSTLSEYKPGSERWQLFLKTA
jgi:hypothetical protein